MMQLICPHCQHSIDYSAVRPRFCSYCGGTLSTAGSTPPETAETLDAPRPPERTQLFDPVAETLPPRNPVNQIVSSTPTEIAGYRIGKRLGGGGMGSVYEAEHIATGQHVALKLIRPECLSPQAIERFRLEGKLASSIAHPRCVFVLAADEENGQPYIVMELMPGSTLTDLVLDRGPLPPKEAIDKILDVIDGLQEAHRVGVIHRDVKPSNCFIDSEGRVKVGDFGLAKMQDKDHNLTRTGAFIGTVLFASPEQIKSQPLDQQADVYSVCATLYYLLTGKAPFSDVDALAATARIVSEDPPSMRKLKPEIPVALDRVVLRGLEREKSKRWPDLESLHAALVQFLPGNMSVGALGYRFGAIVIDWIILTVFQSILWALVYGKNVGQSTDRINADVIRYMPLSLFTTFAIWMVYFSVAERLWGCTIGKWMFRLRVSTVAGEPRPGWLAAIVRSAVFFLIWHVDSLLNMLILTLTWMLRGSEPSVRVQMQLAFAVMLAEFIGLALRIALPLVTMRRRNGYRGPHEFASGTRVVQLREEGRGPSFRAVEFDLPLSHPPQMPDRVGAFKIHGALRWDDHEKMLVGDDPSLGRKVWIWLRPKSEEDLDATRRNLARPTRMRWVAAGQEGDWKWDAFLAPRGFPLVEAIRQTGPIAWSATQPIINRLSGELATSFTEDTLPTPLVAGNVWVDQTSRMQLAGGVALGAADAAAVVEEKSQQAALRMVADVAFLCLEGKPRSPNDHRPVRAPVPRFVSRFLNRFWDSQDSFRDLGDFRGALREIRERPTHVTRPRRFVQVIVLILLAVLPMSCVWSTAILGPFFLSFSFGTIGEQRHASFELTSKVDLAVALVQPDPFRRLQGVGLYGDDRGRLQQLDAEAEKNRQYYEARRRSLNIYFRRVFENQQTYSTQYNQRPVYSPRIRDKERAQLPDEFGHEMQRINLKMSYYSAIAGAIVIPLLWVFWGFMTRGGFSLYFSGMELVRRDGRKASLLQCLIRGLLFWAPLIIILGLSARLDYAYWENWNGFDAAGNDPLWWLSWLSWLLWWGAIVLLAVYLALTLWRPDRAWYDRLVGVWIVPR